MNTENKDPSGEPTKAASGASMESSDYTSGMDSDARKDTVAYSTYKKTLSELKRLKENYEKVLSDQERYEQEKLEAEGKKDEVIERLRRDLEKERQEKDRFTQQMAYEKVSSQIANAAAKRGCRDPQSFVRLIDREFTNLDIGKDFSLDDREINALLDQAEEKYKYFFEKPGPRVADGTPSGPQVSAGKTLNDLTLEEKLRLLAQQTRK